MTDKILVLLVDDDPDLLEVQQRALEQQEDLIVITARNGERALRLLEVTSPHVIVTDMMMPVLDGFGLLRRYHERPGPKAPVIAISSFRDYIEEARQLGAAAVLPKPFQLHELQTLVRALAHGTPAPEPSPHAGPAVDEAARMRAILELDLERPASDEALRAFIDSVAAYFGVPTALVSIVTAERQYWTVACGIPHGYEDTRGTVRGESFCTHAVVARSALVVQDTRENPLFRDNPFVKTSGLRFYAGVPLIARHGEPLGTLCILDVSPRSFTHFDLELLSIFGRRVLAALEWRERQADPAIPESAFRYLQYVDEELAIFGKSAFHELAIVEGLRAAELGRRVACVVAAVPAKRLRPTLQELQRRRPIGLLGRLGHARIGWLVPDASAAEATALALEVAGPHAFAQGTELESHAIAIRTSVQELETALGDAGLI